MAVEDILPEILIELGRVGLWLQAIGAIVVAWIAFQVISFIFERKKKKTLEKINVRLDKIEKKLDRVLKKK